MGKTTRREFIKKSGFTLVTVGVSGRAFYQHLNMAANSALTQAAALSATDNILVVIQLAGGNDGHNMVVPLTDSLYSVYQQRRPTLAVPRQQVLPLNGTDAAGNTVGFHPNLTRLKALMDQGRVGVIQAVGYPKPNRSHFRSMDIWHTANPDKIEGTGWLGDYFDATAPANDNPLIGVYIGGLVPLSLRGSIVHVPAIGNPEAYQLRTDPNFQDDASNRQQTFLAVNRELAPERVYRDMVAQTAIDAYDSSVALQAGISSYPADPGIQYTQTNPLARGLQSVARIIAGDLGTKVLYVTLGGFDTHQGQNGADGRSGHARLMQYLDEAVDTFYRDMVRLGKDEKVLIMTWSEFGRLVPENGNLGTDHGASAPQLVIGTPVKGGVYGEHPSLTDLNPERPDTKFSIDFREIYATVLENWLGADAGDILGGSYQNLQFV